MSNIYLIPKSIPCENCGKKLETIRFTIAMTENTLVICENCETIQAPQIYQRYFGIITNVSETKQ